MARWAPGSSRILPGTFAEIDREFEEFAPLLKLSATKNTLLECWTRP